MTGLVPKVWVVFYGSYINFDVLKEVDLVPEAWEVADAKYARILNSNDPNLAAFRRHGGKLIQYHGWADPAIPAMDSIDYYKRVQARMGDTAGFYRLFMAPGMLHCGGGRGPNEITAPTLNAIAAWVEKGEAPARAAKQTSGAPA